VVTCKDEANTVSVLQKIYVMGLFNREGLNPFVVCGNRAEEYHGPKEVFPKAYMVSIIVPYNKDRGYLAQCLDSIRAQTVTCELIEVESPRSVSCNFNTGLERATGEFVKVVGEDDWLPWDSAENLVNGIGDAPWGVANAMQVDKHGGLLDVYKHDALGFAENVVLNRIHNGGTIYRTEVLREIGGMDETLWTGEEYEMHLRLYSLGYLPQYIDKEVYFYRMWDGGKSRQLRKQDPKKRADEIKRIQSLYIDKV